MEDLIGFHKTSDFDFDVAPPGHTPFYATPAPAYEPEPQLSPQYSPPLPDYISLEPSAEPASPVLFDPRLPFPPPVRVPPLESVPEESEVIDLITPPVSPRLFQEAVKGVTQQRDEDEEFSRLTAFADELLK